MSVRCVQVVDGEPQEPYVIEPHYPEQTDAELMRAKATGAADKGWTVRWTSPTSFVARKVRWGVQAEVERIFTLE
jgi:hypothetical protein